MHSVSNGYKCKMKREMLVMGVLKLKKTLCISGEKYREQVRKMKFDFSALRIPYLKNLIYLIFLC
jgi:hypothetical protein